MLKITAASVAKEFTRRGIPFEVIDEARSMLKFKHNDAWKYVRGSLDDSASPVGVSIADSKSICSKMVSAIGVMTPDEFFVAPHDNLMFPDALGTVVVKPSDAAHGNGVTINVKTQEELDKAIDTARTHSVSGNVLVQQQVSGNDLRVLVINGKIAAATERVPASVTGNGIFSIEQLIERENADNPDRGENYMKKLNFIDIQAAKTYLAKKLQNVPQKDETVQVVRAVNIGLGGTSIDRTDELPRVIAEQALAIARELHVNVCGVDFMTSDIADDKKYYFIEANACPSFGLHLNPAEGKPRPVDIMFVDYLLEKS